MLAMPAKALAHDWDHNGNGRHHEYHDSGHNNGWFQHHRAEQQSQARGYYQPPHYAYGYQQQPRYAYGNLPPSYGYNYQPPRYGYGYQQPEYEGYGRQSGIPANGDGMVSERHPGLVWSCDSQGHHCHWTGRGSSAYGYPQTGLNWGSLFGNNNGYGNNGYYGNSRYGNSGYGSGYNGYNNGYGNGSYGMNSPLGGLGSLLGPMLGGQRP